MGMLKNGLELMVGAVDVMNGKNAVSVDVKQRGLGQPEKFKSSIQR
jgi:hypothetical protein